ncbi:alpha/beta hydrolase [Sphingomonas sp. KR1UV-12]|uniref:Alpha/beta hydrolase n=1 Tax=Sphingomonas aurea TaxID=3063994 RepID=A0ABT9EJ73_9SPHN|nr:alpha/beta hydrolase [Sphingomonas sp. KR1UV-12]MDP1027000.1 alpha/beta hydrolase [Sphingomonas sp. KR1UV-12]
MVGTRDTGRDDAAPAQSGEPSLADVPALRIGMAEQGRSLPAPRVDARSYVADDVPLRLYRPVERPGGPEAPLPLLVFLHGGGWLLGDLDTHDAPCRWLCAKAGCAVLAVGYRLAPEHPFPAALDDTMTAFRWARANAAALGCDPRQVAIGGESAGANLAAAMTLVVRDGGEAPPVFQLLVHPPTDLRMQQPSFDEVSLPGLSRSFLADCIGAYAGAASLDDARLSPLRADDLSGLPPAIVITVENDPLRDDGEQYGLALARAGNDVRMQRLPGLPHGFMFLPATQPKVAAAFRLLGSRVARYFHAL